MKRPHPPLVFLDIDGVLNIPRILQGVASREVFVPSAVAALQHILEKSNARIVLSSSWRVDARDRIPPTFRANGLEKFLEGMDYTPVVEGGQRGDEIEAWLDSRFPPKGRPPYAVLDDDPGAASAGNFVRINDTTGLTMRDAQKALQFLRLP